MISVEIGSSGLGMPGSMQRRRSELAERSWAAAETSAILTDFGRMT